MGFVALVISLWQLARVPLEGSAATSLAHARSWLSAERTLHVHFERPIVAFVHHPLPFDIAHFAYSNVHLFAIVAFMATARLTTPERYPTLRTAFVLAHIPALIAIALFPLAPPAWLHNAPFFSGHHPTDAQLTGSFGNLMRNSTAAVASMHFGYPAFIAMSALWIAPRSPIARLTLLHPPFIFFVIVGVGHHYVLDAGVGFVSVVLGFAAARYLHHGLPAFGSLGRAPPWRVAALALGWALLIDTLDGVSSGRVPVEHPTIQTFLSPTIMATAFVTAWVLRRGRPRVRLPIRRPART